MASSTSPRSAAGGSTAAGAPATWALAGQTARLAGGEFSATVQVDQPGLGIHDLVWAGKRLDAVRHWLAFSEQTPGEPTPSRPARLIEDCYIRGRDLVAVYAESNAHPLRYVVYWRALGPEALCGAAGGFDVVVSVQTSVLDVTPKAWLSSDCDASDVWRVGAASSSWSLLAANSSEACDHAYLVELPGGAWCAAEMIHSQDRIESTAQLVEAKTVSTGKTAQTAKTVQTRHQVLGLRLEKGVLLRARMRVVLVRCEGAKGRDRAKEIVADCREQFERAELPLTT